MPAGFESSTPFAISRSLTAFIVSRPHRYLGDCRATAFLIAIAILRLIEPNCRLSEASGFSRPPLFSWAMRPVDGARHCATVAGTGGAS
jgi:hypothetical protein